jgi:uncharacterized protein YajQ (UPF0234 family)
MAQQNTFDITSKIELAEVENAINRPKGSTLRFQGSKSNIETEAKGQSSSPRRTSTTSRASTIFSSRNSLSAAYPQGADLRHDRTALGGTVRQKDLHPAGHSSGEGQGDRQVHQGLETQGPAVDPGRLRGVAGDRDTLQGSSPLAHHDFGIDMAFTNYRTV